MFFVKAFIRLKIVPCDICLIASVFVPPCCSHAVVLFFRISSDLIQLIETDDHNVFTLPDLEINNVSLKQGIITLILLITTIVIFNLFY